MSAQPKKPLAPDKALERLMTLCISAEHCTHEMMVKLARWGITPADATRIIARLRKEQFIDDRRFAMAYAADKARFNAWGTRKIRLGLMQKRITPDDIEAAIAGIPAADLLEGLKLTLRSKLLTMDREEAATYQGRTKLFRHAASRGFDPEMIACLMRNRELMEELGA